MHFRPARKLASKRHEVLQLDQTADIQDAVSDVVTPLLWICQERGDLRRLWHAPHPRVRHAEAAYIPRAAFAIDDHAIRYSKQQAAQPSAQTATALFRVLRERRPDHELCFCEPGVDCCLDTTQ